MDEMRIAIGGIMHETNTFATLPTTERDFEVVRGEALVQSAFWQQARDVGHELFPLFVAHATP